MFIKSADVTIFCNNFQYLILVSGGSMDELEVFPKAILFIENLVRHSQTSAYEFEGQFTVILT